MLAVMPFGFMAFDGTRALAKGDYIRSQTGTHAGLLGPWHHVANAVGIDPEGTLMKWIFVVFGLAGLVAAFCFATTLPGSRKALLAMNVCSLWYQAIGTATAATQIILLLAVKEKSRDKV